MLTTALSAPAWQRRAPVIAPAPEPVTHCVTHLGEASSAGVGNFVMEEARLWERLAATTPNEIRVNSTTCTGGLSGLVQRNTMTALVVGTAISGAVMGGPVGWTMAALSVGVMAYSTGAASWAIEKSKPSIDDAPVRVERQTVNDPKPELLKTALQQNISRWDGMQIVHISGHGDRTKVAMMPFSEVGPAVDGSDVVLLDACETAQLESMAHLAGHTRVVVGSTHTMIGWGLPLTHLLHDKLPDDPRALGALVVHNNAEKRRARSMVALDMDAFHDKLMPALDSLGQDLSKRLDQGRKDDILQALHDSQFVGSRFSSRADLGSLLENLQARLPDCAPAAEANQAWQATRIAQDGSAGMTVDLVAGRKAEGVPEGWTTFMSKLNRRIRPF